MRGNTKKLALYGICLAFCMVLGYIEHLIPFPIGIYGIKLGLANLGIVVLLYLLGPWAALTLNTARILLSALLFGNAVSLVYSLCGGICSAVLMIILKRTNKFSCIGISICGGVMHNIAQICVAIVMVDSLKIAFYLPVLLITGALTGLAVGSAALPVIKNKYLQKSSQK